MTIRSPNRLPKHRPLQVAVVPGMPVCEIGDGTLGNVVGIIEAFCIYRLNDIETVCVANWRDIALSNVCPASTLLTTDVDENDRRNASVTLLREFVGLERVAPLTAAQQTTMEEVTEFLCDT